MSTELQIEANRQNALVSTGPRTAAGKAKVSRNAIRHGIFAREVVIADGDGQEDQSAYRRLHTALVADLVPEGQMEHLLVEKIAVNYWRLRRVVRYETGQLRQLLDYYIQRAVDSHYTSPLATAASQERVRPVLETYQYGDVIEDGEYEMQVTNVESLHSPDTDLLSDDNFLEFVYYNHFNPEGAAADCEGGEAIPDSEWERLRQWLKALPQGS